MPSLNLDIDYFNHRKTKRLIRLLGKGSEVLPLKLWVYTARYFADDGRLTGISAQEIEDECQWWGSSGEMVRVMLLPEVKFLIQDAETICVHQWIDHEGHISAFSERAQKGAQKRWENYRNRDAPSNPTSNASSIATSNAPTKPPKPPEPTKSFAAEPPAAVEPKVSRPKKKPTGEHHELIDHWGQAWERRYGKPFPFAAAPGRNGKHIQALLETLGFSDAASAMDRYLACDDGFLNGHPLGMLISQLSKFVVEAPIDPDDVGPDGLCAQDRKMLTGEARYVPGRT